MIEFDTKMYIGLSVIVVSPPPNLTPVMYPKMRWRTVVTWELDRLIVKLLAAAGNQSAQIHLTNLGKANFLPAVTEIFWKSK